MERVRHELQDKNLDLKREMTKMESTLEGMIHEREVHEIKEEELLSYEKQLEIKLIEALDQREIHSWFQHLHRVGGVISATRNVNIASQINAEASRVANHWYMRNGLVVLVI